MVSLQYNWISNFCISSQVLILFYWYNTTIHCTESLLFLGCGSQKMGMVKIDNSRWLAKKFSVQDFLFCNL